MKYAFIIDHFSDMSVVLGHPNKNLKFYHLSRNLKCVCSVLAYQQLASQWYQPVNISAQLVLEKA
jgi:hypothetical protein